MLIRLLIAAVAIYLLYRLLWKRKPSAPPWGADTHKPQEEVLVQDPWCKTYLPKSQALSLKREGEVVYFCSRECRERFLGKRSGG